MKKPAIAYRRVTNRAEAEQALDAHRLYAEMRSGAYWLCRRNGKTQTWKTMPDQYRMPIKCGLKVYGNVTPETLPGFFVVAE
jgi:hypothetical protein